MNTPTYGIHSVSAFSPRRRGWPRTVAISGSATIAAPHANPTTALRLARRSLPPMKAASAGATTERPRMSQRKYSAV